MRKQSNLLGFHIKVKHSLKRSLYTETIDIVILMSMSYLIISAKGVLKTVQELISLKNRQSFKFCITFKRTNKCDKNKHKKLSEITIDKLCFRIRLSFLYFTNYPQKGCEHKL